MCAWLQTCGCLSEGSKRATNFYELEAQVKGGSSLEESLVSLPALTMSELPELPPELYETYADVHEYTLDAEKE